MRIHTIIGLLLIISSVALGATITVPVESHVVWDRTEGGSEIILKVNLPEDLTDKSHIVDATLCLELSSTDVEAVSPSVSADKGDDFVEVMQLNKSWHRELTSESFYADSNVVNTSQRKVEIVRDDAVTCIDLRSYICDWLDGDAANNGLIIRSSGAVRNLSVTMDKESPVGKLKIKYIPRAK